MFQKIVLENVLYSQDTHTMASTKPKQKAAGASTLGWEDQQDQGKGETVGTKVQEEREMKLVVESNSALK